MASARQGCVRREDWPPARSPPFTARCSTQPRLPASSRLQPPPCTRSRAAHAPNTLRLLPTGRRRRPFLDKRAGRLPENRRHCLEPAPPLTHGRWPALQPTGLPVRSGQVRSAPPPCGLPPAVAAASGRDTCPGRRRRWSPPRCTCPSGRRWQRSSVCCRRLRASSRRLLRVPVSPGAATGCVRQRLARGELAAAATGPDRPGGLPAGLGRCHQKNNRCSSRL